jgi:hypothetical protein
MATVTWDPGRVKTLSIPINETETDILDLKGLGTRNALAILFLPPGTLTGTIKIHVAESPTGTFNILQSGAADITLAVGKATQIDSLTAGALKIVSGSVEAAQRDFRLLAGALN